MRTSRPHPLYSPYPLREGDIKGGGTEGNSASPPLKGDTGGFTEGELLVPVRGCLTLDASGTLAYPDTAGEPHAYQKAGNTRSVCADEPSAPPGERCRKRQTFLRGRDAHAPRYSPFVPLKRGNSPYPLREGDSGGWFKEGEQMEGRHKGGHQGGRHGGGTPPAPSGRGTVGEARLDHERFYKNNHKPFKNLKS